MQNSQCSANDKEKFILVSNDDEAIDMFVKILKKLRGMPGDSELPIYWKSYTTGEMVAFEKDFAIEKLVELLQ